MALSIRGAALALCVLPTAAQGQAPCFPADRLARELARQSGEVPAGAGMGAKSILQLYVNPQTGSFTVVRVLPPDGQRGPVACMIAAGTGWRVLAPVVGEPS